MDIFTEYSKVFISTGFEDGAPKIYAERRKEFLKRIDSICILGGVEKESEARIVQNPDFLYLTGINQSGAILVLDPNANKNEKEILFLCKKDQKKEFWNGIRLGLPDPQVFKITGFTTILPLEDFENWFAKKIKQVKTAYSNEIIRKKIFTLIKKHKKSSQEKIALKAIEETHIAQRIVLEPERINFARKAQSITREAFLGLLKNIRNHKNEREVNAELEARMLAQTSEGLAFPSIVASGKNACTLHYVKKDETIREGSLILLDFGCRYNTVCSDISRTVPFSGKFNPLQKLLYNIVLDTQKFHQRNIKPNLKLRGLNMQTWLYLEALLSVRFKEKGGEETRAYQGKAPHGVSHLIGDIVHEGIPNKYLDYPLQAGMIISNEPGIYGHFEMEIDGELYSEHIGIRIEDDLLITEKGCINLSAAIPKSIEEIEHLL